MKQPSTKRSTNILVSIFLILTLLLSLGGNLLYRYQKKNITIDKYNELLAISKLKVDQLVKWRKDHMDEASEALYGWTASEVLGLKLNEILVNHEPQDYSKEIKNRIKNGLSWSRGLNVKKRDGTYIPTHITHTPILDGKEDPNGVIGISFDISERRKTEEAMLKKMDELAASNEEFYRINRLTIGREIRMIELKHHCNALAVQLGIEKPFPLAFLNEPDQEKTS